MDADSERRLSELEANTSIALGRPNAIHMLTVVIARQLSPDVAARCAKSGREAQARVAADLIAAPLPESMINEMQRVMSEAINLFELAARSNPRVLSSF